jgi:phosphatidylglycerophosphate synthase
MLLNGRQEMPQADSYSSIERRVLAPGRRLLLRLYLPLIRPLASAGVSPHAVSALGPILGLVFVYTVRHNARLSALIWVLSVWVDGVDGTLARYSGRASDFGALVDQIADHTRETLIVVGLVAAGALSPFWGALYPFVYTALNVTLFLANHYRAAVPVAVKSWMVLYPAILAYLLLDRNWLSEATSASVALMGVTILYGLILLRPRMNGEG